MVPTPLSSARVALVGVDSSTRKVSSCSSRVSSVVCTSSVAVVAPAAMVAVVAVTAV